MKSIFNKRYQSFILSTPKLYIPSKIYQRYQSTVYDYDVMITGGGPNGLFMSLLLSYYKIPFCLIEKKIQCTKHPQAHFLNARTMEIIKSYFPRLYHSILNASIDRKYWDSFTYCNSIIEDEIAIMNHFDYKLSDPLWENTPSNVLHLPQNIFEDLLRKELLKMHQSHDHLYFGYELNSIVKASRDENKSIVEANIRSIASPLTSRIITSKYLIGADGANSFVRKSLNINLIGKENIQTLMNIHFQCPGLYELLKSKEKKLSMLYFIFNESSICVFVCHNPLLDEWCIQIPIFPPYQILEDYSIEEIKQLIQQGIGIPKELNIYNIGIWTMNAQVAESFHNKHLNIFLVGDAAHRFPPAGGFGMNSGLQDIFNLAWKLYLTISNKASYRLLISYNNERRKIALEYTKLSLINYKKSLKVASLLGYESTIMINLQDVLALSPLSLTIKKRLFVNTLAIGLQVLGNLKKLPVVENILKKKVQEYIQSGNALQLIFPIEDIGYCYDKTSLFDINTFPYQDTKQVEKHLSNPFKGCRIPHCWFLSFQFKSIQVISSLDITSLINTTNNCTPFILIILDQDVNKEGYLHVLSSIKVNKSLIAPVIIQHPDSYQMTSQSHTCIQSIYQLPRFHNSNQLDDCNINDFNKLICFNRKDNVLHLLDMTLRWYNISKGNIILLRPDGHIAEILNSKDKANERQNQIQNLLDQYHLIYQ